MCRNLEAPAPPRASRQEPRGARVRRARGPSHPPRDPRGPRGVAESKAGPSCVFEKMCARTPGRRVGDGGAARRGGTVGGWEPQEPGAGGGGKTVGGREPQAPTVSPMVPWVPRHRPSRLSRPSLRLALGSSGPQPSNLETLDRNLSDAAPRARRVQDGSSFLGAPRRRTSRPSTQDLETLSGTYRKPQVVVCRGAGGTLRTGFLPPPGKVRPPGRGGSIELGEFS